MKKPPVIFLAFANDQDDSLSYLRRLPEEARRLREVLDGAESRGLCELEVRSNVTASEIFTVFRRYRDRIAIFHYGGHANGYQLLLESSEQQGAAADASGFAEFLGQQRGLQLVFLNGCSTQQQTQGLLDANVASVIATSRAIDDGVATDFASHFYKELAGGDGSTHQSANTIQRAFNSAVAAIKTERGNDVRAMYFGKLQAQDHILTDRWPWELTVREGAEVVTEWSLSKAVDDPLFGLPPLPEQDLPDEPYLGLKRFTRKYADVFFGRGHDIRKLYDRLTAHDTAPIILYYGQSGVGKSSVLEAGLLPRLEQLQEVNYRRRESDALLDTLHSMFESKSDSAWKAKEQQTGRPLTVILDQVEEVFTRPLQDKPNELDELLEFLTSVFSDVGSRPGGKLILSFRKEWLAEIEEKFKEDNLPRQKVYLKSLDDKGIVDVIEGPTRSDRLKNHYKLQIEENLAETIANSLAGDSRSPVAPTLQVLLTKMWANSQAEDSDARQFSLQLYHRLQREGILLSDFLDQQIDEIAKSHPNEVKSGLLLDILLTHTTPLGTSNQLKYKDLETHYAHIGEKLWQLIQQCQDRYLLTIETINVDESTVQQTRLAHDTLAPLVRTRFEDSDTPGKRARRILDAKSPNRHDADSSLMRLRLDNTDLATVEGGKNGTRSWNTAERRLIKESKCARARRRIMLCAAVILVGILVAVTANNEKRRHQERLISESLGRIKQVANFEKQTATFKIPIETFFTYVDDLARIGTTGLIVPPTNDPRQLDLHPLTELPDLELLDLSVHDVSDLSPLRKLKRLKTLRLRTRQSVDLEPLYGLINLECLNFETDARSSEFDLSKLASSNLKSLKLDGWKFKNCEQLQRMRSLKDLDFYDIEAPELRLANLPHLEQFTVRYAKPGSTLKLVNLPKLKTISLQNVKFTSILKLVDLPLLEHFTIQNAQLTSGLSLVDLPRLKQIAIQSARIESLILRNLTVLDELNLVNGNDIQIRNLELTDLGKLEKLRLNVQNLGAVRLVGLEGLRSLTIIGSQISELPLPVPALEVLTLQLNNQLTELHLHGFHSLTEVSATKNALTHVSVEQASKLLILDVSENELTTLRVSDAGSLTVLTAAKNCRLSDLSEVNAPGIRRLNLNDTSLRDIGPIRRFERVRSLDVSRTKVDDISHLLDHFDVFLDLTSVELAGSPVCDVNPNQVNEIEQRLRQRTSRR